MEDRYIAEYVDMPQGDCAGLFAIYDGHGGKKCVNYIQENLMDAILNHPEFSEGDMAAAYRTPPLRSLHC
jgi:serine/threonine protein phosphatase PrpC